jgi:hypothetical protein
MEEPIMSCEWKNIPNTNDHYSISNQGLIKRNDSGVILKQGLNHKGYKTIQLSVYNKRKYLLVSRCVAMAFIPNPEGKAMVNHKDGNRINNCVSNLEWCTAKENQIHAFRVLGHWKGESAPGCKLKEMDVIKCRTEYFITYSYREMAEMLCVTYQTIWHLMKGITWTHLNLKYPPHSKSGLK